MPTQGVMQEPWHTCWHRVERLNGQVGPIANKRGVTACLKGSLGTIGHIGIDGGTGHREIVANHNPFESDTAPQDVAYPARGKPRGLGIDLAIDHMGRHHSLHQRTIERPRTESRVRPDIVREDLIEWPVIDRQRMV